MQKIPITAAGNKVMKLPDQVAKEQILAITKEKQRSSGGYELGVVGKTAGNLRGSIRS
jgi:hypothetical protein